jgi:predicted DCC family thiol-disulfide oxidoreductase YuxK
MERKVKVIYDDGCPTCTVGISLAGTLDHADSMEFIGMNTDAGKHIIAEKGLDMVESAYVIDGERVEGKAAFMREVFSRGGVIGFLISLPFRIPIIGNAIYYLLALHRAHVTKTEI